MSVTNHEQQEKYKHLYLSYVLRHNPDLIKLDMDRHGWVDVAQLISNVNAAGQHTLSVDVLQEIVDTDSKGRYRLSADGKKSMSRTFDSLG